MSIVRPGLVRKCYKNAVEDIDPHPSRFWDAILQRAFNDPETYSVTIEPLPSGGLERVDQVVQHYDDGTETLRPILFWIEGKRLSGDVEEVEKQALDAAKRYIDRDDMESIWAMTTVGVSFRFWLVRHGVFQLEAIHGRDTRGDLGEYIDADSPAAAAFSQSIDRIKLEIPRHKRTALLSQP